MEFHQWITRTNHVHSSYSKLQTTHPSVCILYCLCIYLIAHFTLEFRLGLFDWNPEHQYSAQFETWRDGLFFLFSLSEVHIRSRQSRGAWLGLLQAKPELSFGYYLLFVHLLSWIFAVSLLVFGRYILMIALRLASAMTRLVCFSIRYNAIFYQLLQCTSWSLDDEQPSILNTIKLELASLDESIGVYIPGLARGYCISI